jgi:hypothetical protein
LFVGYKLELEGVATMQNERKRQSSDKTEGIKQIEALQSIRNARLAKVMKAEAPLKGIYCVYSMYWRPRHEGLES